MQNIEIRDWFASMVLGHLPRLWDEEETEKNVARAYALVDAMLAARGPAKAPAPQPELAPHEIDMIRLALREQAEQMEANHESFAVHQPLRDLAKRFAAPT